MPRDPQLSFAFEARVTIAPPLDLGDTRAGHRRVIPILGGTFEGPRIRGKVLEGGADWQILHADGAADPWTQRASLANEKIRGLSAKTTSGVFVG